MRLRVKICGITKVEQGQAIARLGATALGFICAQSSPRYVAPAQIGMIVAALPRHPQTGAFTCDRVGVFVNADLTTIRQTVAIGNLNSVQLHGNESPEFCDRLRYALPTIEIIKALRVPNAKALHQTRLYTTHVDALLLDAYHPNMSGGTGITLDWQALQTFQPGCTWLLAGGLTPDNVLIALSLVTPDGVDLSSGVEHTPGDKNLEQVARLFECLQMFERPQSEVGG